MEASNTNTIGATREIVFTGKNPFKFLDPYSEKEQEHHFFFGREEEENELYDFVKRTKVLLLYGVSGSGKTSLLQCGLSHKFRLSSGWIPVFIRRGNNINQSLREAIQDKLRSTFSQDAEEGSAEKEQDDWEPEEMNSNQDIFNSLKLLYSYTLRPVFLVFDQFEEFILMSNDAEKEQFAETLRFLFEARNNPYFNIIILMREEYFGPFDTIMKDIKGIADWRMRLRPLKKKVVISVIEKLLTYFNISLTDPKEDLKRIYNALKNNNGEVSLSNLQIYLYQFWEEDFKREHNNAYPPGGNFPPITFKTEEIITFGSIDVVLQRFLLSQKKAISAQLKKKFPHAPELFLNMVLNEFIADEGSKKPAHFKIKHGHYHFIGDDNGKLNEFNRDMLKYTLELLEKNRIIRTKTNSIELTHDSLAKLIFDVRDARYKKQLRIRQRLKAVEEGTEEVAREEVFGWSEYMEDTVFTKHELTYFNKLKRTKEEEHLRSKFRKNLIKVSLVIIGICGGLSWFYQYSKMKDNQDFYAIQFMDKLDTLANGKDALLLAKYLHDGLNDTINRKTIENKMLQLASGDNFQRQFLNNEYVYNLTDNGKTIFKENEFGSLSNNGNYLIQYVRTINDTIGIIIYSAIGIDTLYEAVGFHVNENELLIYDLKLKKLKLCNFKNIHNPIATYQWNESQNGQISFTFPPYQQNKGRFVVPFSKNNRNRSYSALNGIAIIDFYNKNNPLKIINIETNCSINQAMIENDLILFEGTNSRNRWIFIYDTAGKQLLKKPINRTDFLLHTGYISKKGNIVYATNDSFFISTNKAKSFTGYKQSPNFESIFYLNIEQDYYISDSASAIKLYNFSGEFIKSYNIPFEISTKQFDYINKKIALESAEDPVLRTRFIYVLDSSLKLIASFPKTTGSPFFLAANGKAIATIRNKSVFVYPIAGNNLAFHDFKSLNTWLEQQKKAAGKNYKPMLESLKKKYQLNKPGFFG